MTFIIFSLKRVSYLTGTAIFIVFFIKSDNFNDYFSMIFPAKYYLMNKFDIYFL